MTTSGPAGADSWRRANDLFHRALALPKDDREAFLQRECATDEALRREVSALLDAHSRSDAFLEQTADLVAGREGLPSAADSLVGRQVAHYRIERILGIGGMGVVYLAHDDRLGRPVALKAITPAFTHDPTRRERLRREARAAASLTHPGIATVYAFEEVDNHVFIVGEYVAGETLREEASRGPLAPAQTIETAIGIASALAAAHDRGIVHRDLKPENLIRTPGGQIKILDFGLARPRDVSEQAGLTEDGSVLGTPAYMAPEQIRRDAVDGRADIFSLGVVMYELVTGVQPFSGGDAASTIARILETDPPGFAEGDSATLEERRVRSALDAIVRTCLRKAPEARFANAHQLASALERARAGRTDSVPMELSMFGVALRWWKFHQLATCLAYAGVMVPLWIAKGTIPGSTGRYLFLAGLAAAVASVVLRLHLWFTASSLPTEWRQQQRSARPWLHVADSAMVVACLIAGGLTIDLNSALAPVLLCAGVAILLSFTVIEPATTRAAFGS